jgi:hypothetical protein
MVYQELLGFIILVLHFLRDCFVKNLFNLNTTISDTIILHLYLQVNQKVLFIVNDLPYFILRIGLYRCLYNKVETQVSSPHLVNQPAIFLYLMLIVI